MAIDPSTLEYQYRRYAGSDGGNQKSTYGVEFSSGGSNYTFIPSSVINKGVAAGDSNYVMPWFLNQDNLGDLGKVGQFVDLAGQSWYGDYLKDTVGASTEGFLVPSGSLAFDSQINVVPSAVQGLGNTQDGLSYILDKQGSDGKYVSSDGIAHTITAGRSLLGKVFGGLGDTVAGAIMGGVETLGGLPPVVTAAISAYNPALGAAISGAKVGAAIGSGQADLGDLASTLASSYAGSQLGAAVGGGAAGQFAGNTASGLLQGQGLEDSLTNAAINTGANAAANGLLSPSVSPEVTVPNAVSEQPPTDYSIAPPSSGGLGLKADLAPLDPSNPYSFDLTNTGGLGFNANLAPSNSSNPYSLDTNFGNLDAMGGGTGITVPTQPGATLGAIGTEAKANPASNSANPAATGLLASFIKSALTGSQGTGNMATQDNTSALGSLFQGLLGGAGSLMQGDTNVAARQEQANALRQAGQQAATASQFRPVGTTTTFGTSNFQVDPTTGQLQSAGYNLSPQLQQYQNTIMGGGQQSLTDAANLQNLGRGYIAQSPEAAAQQYMANQQALLAPSRDMESARLANQLQQTGRTGVSVAQGGSLGMANPEQQALANARAIQDLNLAAQAQQQGRAQTTFGQGLLTGAYDPFNAGLKTASTVEGLGQQPLGLSTDLAKNFQQANSTGAKYNLAAQDAATAALFPANQYNPYASLLSGLAGNTQATTAAGNLFGNTAIGSSLAKYLSGLSASNLNTAASDWMSANPDIIPASTFKGGGADDMDPELKALLGL